MPDLTRSQNDDQFEPLLRALAEGRKSVQESVAGLAEDNFIRDLQTGTIDQRIDKILKALADRKRRD